MVNLMSILLVHKGINLRLDVGMLDVKMNENFILMVANILEQHFEDTLHLY